MRSLNLKEEIFFFVLLNKRLDLSPRFYITTMHIYSDENVLEEFYKAIASGDPSRVRRVHIPKSDVFYVRRAYFEATGNWETLDRIERCMFLEGMLRANEVFEPKRKRDWEDVPIRDKE